MKIYWSETARRELADMWLSAGSDRRRAITAAAQSIDTHLAKDPESAGESRPENVRIFFAPPLGVLFRLEADGAIVHVVHVWQFR